MNKPCEVLLSSIVFCWWTLQMNPHWSVGYDYLVVEPIFSHKDIKATLFVLPNKKIDFICCVPLTSNIYKCCCFSNRKSIMTQKSKDLADVSSLLLVVFIRSCLMPPQETFWFESALYFKQWHLLRPKSTLRYFFSNDDNDVMSTMWLSIQVILIFVCPVLFLLNAMICNAFLFWGFNSRSASSLSRSVEVVPVWHCTNLTKKIDGIKKAS